MLIDEELKFYRQTAAALKKANSILGLTRKSFVAFDKVSLGLLYKSLVRPHLEYYNVIWGPFYKGDIITVEIIQRRETKLVPELENLPFAHKSDEQRRGKSCTEWVTWQLEDISTNYSNMRQNLYG